MADKRFQEDVIGQVRSVTPEQAALGEAAGAEEFNQRAARQRYQQEQDIHNADRDYGTVGQFGVGALSGLTLGLGPAIGAGVAGAIDPEAGERAKHDIRGMEGGSAFGAGEIAGMLAPMVFSGGTALEARVGAEAASGGGLLSRVFGASPAGLVGQVGGAAERLAARALPEAASGMGKAANQALGLAARGMTEGALISATQTVSHNIIHDQPLTAQTLMASGVDGALLGGLLGGGLGLAGAGVGRLAEAGLDLGAKGGPNVVLRHLGASAEDIQKFGGEAGVRDSLKGFHDIVLKPAGSDFSASASKINGIARESAEAFEKVQKDVVATLSKEAPHLVPDLPRVQLRMAQEALEPMAGTLSYGSAKRAVESLQDRLVGLGDKGGPKAYGTWETWMDARNQLNSINKLVPDPETSAFLKSRLLGVFDSELNEAMEAAGKSLGTDGLAKQFQAAVGGERLARGLEDITAGKAMAGPRSLLGPNDMSNAALGLAMGHPLGGLGMMGVRAVGRAANEAVTPMLAQRAYELSVGANAAASVGATKGLIKTAVGKFFQGTERGVLSTGLKSRGAYEKQLERTSELVSPNHANKVQQYADALTAVNQAALGQELVMANQRAAEYLRYNMPPSRKTNNSTSLMKVPETHGLSADEWKFFRVDNAIKKPLSLLENIGNGSVTSEEVRAIKYVYPELYSEVVQGVTQGIFDLKQAGEHVSMDKVTQLGIVLDAVIDPVLEPSFIADVQASMQVPEQPGPEPQRNDQIDPVNLQTPTEQMNYRGA